MQGESLRQWLGNMKQTSKALERQCLDENILHKFLEKLCVQSKQRSRKLIVNKAWEYVNGWMESGLKNKDGFTKSSATPMTGIRKEGIEAAKNYEEGLSF